LDSWSLSLIRQKNLNSFAGGRGEASFQNAVRVLERAISEDSARNRYTLETTLHRWFVEGTITKDLSTLNERVYADLFLTPSSDAWLGLFPNDSYTGIENDGIRR
jgi:hypothetical protein